MSSLNARGGGTIKNRILNGSPEEKKCPFSVMAYESGNGSYKAFIEDGEINFTRYYAKNGGGAAAAEVTIQPDCELALMVSFQSNDYEYRKIEGIYIATNFNAGQRDAFATQVVPYGGNNYGITLYIPLAYIFFDTSTTPRTLKVRQYFCDNIEFRMYFTAINGVPCFEFFKIHGLTPGEIPES